MNILPTHKKFAIKPLSHQSRPVLGHFGNAFFPTVSVVLCYCQFFMSACFYYVVLKYFHFLHYPWPHRKHYKTNSSSCPFPEIHRWNAHDIPWPSWLHPVMTSAPARDYYVVSVVTTVPARDTMYSPVHGLRSLFWLCNPDIKTGLIDGYFIQALFSDRGRYVSCITMFHPHRVGEGPRGLLLLAPP